MKNKGKRYNEEFRADIIRLIREENRPVSSIVKDFGVNDQTVRNWLKEIKDKQDPDKVKITELVAELKESTANLSFGFRKNMRNILDIRCVSIVSIIKLW